MRIDIVTRIIVTVMAECFQELMQRQAARIEIVTRITVTIMADGCTEL